MQRRQLLATAAGVLAAPGALRAQTEATMRWIVPYPAGGGTDVLARTLAETMRTGLGQTIVVDNRPGASTNIGAELVARAKPDGNTIMSADNALMAFNEHLFKKLPVKPDTDFSYLGAIGKFPLALVVNPAFPAQSFKEFMALVKAKPGQLSYASPGNGSPHHLAMELFKNRTQSFIVHIPYRGAAPAMQDVIGGQVPCMFLDLASGLATMQSGRVRVLAYGSRSRSPLLPSVPTLFEEGVRDVEVFAFQGLLGPAGMPAETVGRINAELNKALANATVLKRFTDFGMEPMPGTPAQFRTLAREESARWGPIIKNAGIVLD